MTKSEELAALGFARSQCRVPALLIPVWNIHGEVALHQVRPDNPRTDNTGRIIKYESPAGQRLAIDVPRSIRHDLGNPAVPMIITEGARKADAAVSAGGCCIALLGVWSWRGTNEHGGKTALPDWHEIALNDRIVHIAFDSDVITKPQVRSALGELGRFLTNKGARIRYCDLGSGDATKIGLDDYLAAGGSLDALLAKSVSQLAAGEPELWKPPIPLTEHNVPPFPNQLFPEDFGDYVNAVATAAQTPMALPGMIGLAVVAAAAQKHVRVRAWDGWDEPVNLYTAISLSPANRKSAVVAKMVAPLRDWERGESQRLRPSLAAEASDRRIKEAALKRAEHRAANEDDPTKALKVRADARMLADQLDALKITRSPRLLVDDITPEKLGALMAEHDSKMAVISAEGSIFDIMAGRFSRDGRSPALDLFLRGHSGDDLPVDRLGREGGYLSAPALTLGLAIQPHVLTGLAHRPGFRGTGLLARFAFALPDSLIGQRQVNPGPVSDELRSRYSKRINEIVSFPTDSDENGSLVPRTLELTAEARCTLVAFLERLELRLGPSGDLHHIGDWAGKLGGLTLRIAGLCHTWQHADTGAPWVVPLSAETLGRSVAFAEQFLIPHALAAFGEMGTDRGVDDARHLLDILTRWEESTFSKRDLHQRIRRRFVRPCQLDKPLELLVDHGYLRPLAPLERDETRGRKPSDRYEINPRWERTRKPLYTRIGDNRETTVNIGDSVYTSRVETRDSASAASAISDHHSDGTLLPGEADGMEWEDFG